VSHLRDLGGQVQCPSGCSEVIMIMILTVLCPCIILISLSETTVPRLDKKASRMAAAR
jgi:hypothetical protein